MRKEEASPEKDMGAAAGDALKAVDEVLVEALAAELVDQLVVVNLTSLRRHLPRIDNLFLLAFFYSPVRGLIGGR